MFRIKICGVTNCQDAVHCQMCGADAVGLNFYARSLRSIDQDTAIAIADSLDPSVAKVGVFVDETAATINQISRQCQLDYVQLHGNESTELLREIELPVIRAIRWRDLVATQTDCIQWQQAGAAAILLDAQHGRQFGGTGTTIDWNGASKLESELPLILAGGLDPDNVADAISIVRPSAADSASGTESLPGKKEPDTVRRFIRSALTAFKSISNS